MQLLKKYLSCFHQLRRMIKSGQWNHRQGKMFQSMGVPALIVQPVLLSSRGISNLLLPVHLLTITNLVCMEFMNQFFDNVWKARPST